MAGQFQWQFDYLGPDGQTILYTRAPAADGGRRRDGRAGRPDGAADARQQRRHPRLLRPAVPVQARRRAGPDQPVRLHGQRSRMPARRSAASAPSCAASGHAIMLFDVKALTATEFDAWLADKIAKANATPPPPPSGGRGETVDRSAPSASRSSRPRSRPGRQAVPDRVREQGRRHAAQRRDPPGHADRRRGVQGRGLQRASPPRPTTSRRSPAGAYAFVCTVHPTMTGTLTVQ